MFHFATVIAYMIQYDQGDGPSCGLQERSHTDTATAEAVWSLGHWKY